MQVDGDLTRLLGELGERSEREPALAHQRFERDGDRLVGRRALHRRMERYGPHRTTLGAAQGGAQWLRVLTVLWSLWLHMRADVVERRQAVVSRLLALRASGRLASGVVRAAAESLGVCERSVWRWLAAGAYEPGWRIGWRTSEEAVEVGEDGRRRYSVYRRWEPKARNEVWETDHDKLDVEVLPLRGRRLLRAWLTVIEDGFSRLVMGGRCRCIRRARRCWSRSGRGS